MDRNKLLLIYFSGLKRNSSHGSIESKIDENEYLSLFSDAKPKKNKENSGLRKFLPINYHCISVKTYKTGLRCSGNTIFEWQSDILAG